MEQGKIPGALRGGAIRRAIADGADHALTHRDGGGLACGFLLFAFGGSFHRIVVLPALPVLELSLLGRQRRVGATLPAGRSASASACAAQRRVLAVQIAQVLARFGTAVLQSTKVGILISTF